MIRSLAACCVLGASLTTAPDGPITTFLGEPAFDLHEVHAGGRFPNVLTTVDGTVLTVWGDVEARRELTGDGDIPAR